MAKLLSDALKYELAQEMGVAHKVKGRDYGDLTSRECGNFVKLVLLRAERDRL
jgi:small acid-soluble spore protein F (minor alpha/beta-type SASP)